ncbi:uncharacterized protein LOC113227727 [Hyposmocoma kahamanoa]|uniref:uncharacterized protein LOC113227727 n=1 Tax=Hyposmocoma kahamanoa TaxID=1477025 RepID=UPI000E6D8E99|nr:uncharacterized protein LOC113227727 [Hyposmocoma kahamanoa]
MNKKNKYRNVPKRRVKREDDECEGFKWESGVTKLQSPLSKNSSTSKDGLYASNVDCYTVIRGQTGQQVVLTFINEFHIEYHPTCNYDYIQIRDGEYGYAKSLGKFCGNAFPQVIHSSGPYLWLKFHSDSTIEYVGFQIQIDLIEAAKSRPIPGACMKEVVNVTNGVIDTSQIDPDCKKFVSESESRGLDVVWKITTAAETKIYLNFTAYNLAKPNECEENYIQIFGRELEEEKRLAIYCGSVANAVNSQDNIMYIRMYTSKTAEKGSTFNATFNAYRQLDPNKDNDVCREDEFDCEDNTCIDGSLKCNEYANCRLKTDEDKDTCKGETTSKINEPHIMVILVIFSLILSGMSFVFLFKCIRKLYQDHKIIKEHISQSCEDRLDNLLADSRFPLDAKKLQRTSEPRASLERENHTNEMFKKQRSFSQRKRTSIDSDYIQETPLDLDDEPWQRNVESAPIEAQDIKIERNGRSRRSEMSKREESIRSKKESKEIEERGKKEIRDVSVGAPDTKESGCQTRESLFQADTAPSSDGSNGTNSRGFSTFGYSGATIVRPSPPAPSNTSQITLELLKQVPQQDPIKSQKKIPDRRPMSAETTRSAPDVIIVSKPIR